MLGLVLVLGSELCVGLGFELELGLVLGLRL